MLLKETSNSAAEELLMLTFAWPSQVPPRENDPFMHEGRAYLISSFLPKHREDWFEKIVTLKLQII